MNQEEKDIILELDRVLGETVNDEQINDLIRRIDEEVANLNSDEPKICDFCFECKNLAPWQKIMPQLVRRMNVYYPLLPPVILYLFLKPKTLWHFMRKLAFQSADEMQSFLNSKNAIRTLFWKADLAAMFGCFDASCFLKHAAMRLLRNDMKSASHLYNVAMTQVLRKLISGIKNKRITVRESLSKTEVDPIKYRKHRRNNKKISKVKTLVMHSLYRNRSLIKKTCRVTDDKFKNVITEIAFSDPDYYYPRKSDLPQDIVEDIDLTNLKCICDNFDYQTLKSDDDNKYLKEDILRFLKKKDIIENNESDNSTSQNNDQDVYQKSDYLQKENPLHQVSKSYITRKKVSYDDITKLRLKSFFRHYDCPLLENILLQHYNSNDYNSNLFKDWIDERDLPILIDDVEKHDDPKQQITFDEMVNAFYENNDDIFEIVDPSEVAKYYGLDERTIKPIDPSDPIYAELRKEFLSIKNQNIDRNNKKCDERNNDIHHSPNDTESLPGPSTSYDTESLPGPSTSFDILDYCLDSDSLEEL